MPTITIRNLSDDIVNRMKASASRHGISMEKEIRKTLTTHYMIKEEVIQRIHDRQAKYPRPEAKDIEDWIEKGRETEHGD